METPDINSVLEALETQGAAPAGGVRVAQQLVEALPVPVFFKARDGRYLGVNKAWEEFFGISRAEMVGTTVHELYRDHPETAQRHRLMDEALWSNPGSQSYEIPVTTRRGATRHTLYYKATFNHVDGTVAGLIGTIIDITDRTRTERREAIEHAVARHLGGSESLEDAIRGILRVMCERLEWTCAARWKLDERENRLHCIETWSVADARIRDFLETSARATFVPGKTGLIREVLATGNSVWISDVSTRDDFLRAPLAASAGLKGAFALPVVIGDKVLGAIEFFSRETRVPDNWLLNTSMAVGRQIGQLMVRREAEAALRESEARFRSLTELSSDWYWEQDKELRFTEMSGGVIASIDIHPERFLGKVRWDVALVGVSDQELDAHKALLAARKPFLEFEYGRADEGNVHYISASGRPKYDENGRFAGYRGVGKDITRRKTDEAALREAHDALNRKADELTRSNEELQQFAYVASHDLQEPLRMVSSYTQLLVRRYESKLDGDARDFMGFIVDGAARMKQLIEDLLEYSRVGMRGHDFEPVESGQALDKALINLRASQRASGARITHDELPIVKADDGQLVQLFQNLVGNAIKFRGVAAPEIHVSAQARDGEWLFAVKDNGIGLDTHYAERIFMMFQRLHNKADYPGTGIGLAICKKIVERHGGRIWVESQPGHGCTFSFTLPKVPGGIE